VLVLAEFSAVGATLSGLGGRVVRPAFGARSAARARVGGLVVGVGQVVVPIAAADFGSRDRVVAKVAGAGWGPVGLLFATALVAVLAVG
jgi:hypothetical protein